MALPPLTERPHGPQDAHRPPASHPEDRRRRRRGAGARGAHRRCGPEDLRPGRALPWTENPTRRAIGSYPAISLEQARNTARDWIALVQRGIDPAVQVATEREANRVRASNTFGAVAESFLEKHAASRRTAAAIGRLVRGKLISRWRDRPIDTIGKRDVIAMIEDVQEKSGAAMARQSLTYARRLFGWAAARDLVAVNPCAAVAPPISCRRRSARDRVLTDTELALVLKATARRRVSHRALHPLSVDDGVSTPGSCRRGMGRVRPRAGNMAVAGCAGEECQRARAAVAPGGARSARGTAALCGLRLRLHRPAVVRSAGLSRRKAELDARIAELNGGVPIAPFTWHDLRRSAASGMAALGIAPHVIESILNHRSGVISGVARIYNRHDFRAEKAHALATWAAHLDRLEHGDDAGNVVRLRP